MIERLVTGGQSGAEQAAWASARRAGIATGGYMASGFATEDGPSPRVGALYGAIEFPANDARRPGANLRRADALLFFGDPETTEGLAALAACAEQKKPSMIVRPGLTTPAEVVAWLSVFDVKVLMVAGVPPSRDPGLGASVGAFLDRVFVALRRRPH